MKTHEVKELLADKNVDPKMLAKISYENKEFRADVAKHPKTYPALLRWLALFGDERAVNISLTRLELLKKQFDAGKTEPQATQPQTQPQAQPQVMPAVSENPAVIAANAPQIQPQVQPQAQVVQPAQAVAQPVTQPVIQPQAQPVAQTGVQSPTLAQLATPAQPQVAVASQVPAQAPVQTVVQPQPTVQQPQDMQQMANTPTGAHGFTIMQAMDPNLDQNVMADIAEQAPELREYLVRNRSIYPELLEWLSTLGDPKINAALSTRQ